MNRGVQFVGRTVASINVDEWCLGVLDEAGIPVTTESLAEAITYCRGLIKLLGDGLFHGVATKSLDRIVEKKKHKADLTARMVWHLTKINRAFPMKLYEVLEDERPRLLERLAESTEKDQ